MTYFNADMRLLPLTPDEWELHSRMVGAKLAAHNLTQSTQAGLDRMRGWVDAGAGVLTAAKKAFLHARETLNTYEELDGNDAARGVLIRIIEEYARRRFEVDLDLYWEVEDE